VPIQSGADGIHLYQAQRMRLGVGHDKSNFITTEFKSGKNTSPSREVFFLVREARIYQHMVFKNTGDD
jgi:hypothetical protein